MEPEFSPGAAWYSNGPTGGACEAYFIKYTSEGRLVAATYQWGTEEYYQAVIDGTEMMHAVGACEA
jgi:hypothetical protein